jgi:hypothetical protein
MEIKYLSGLELTEDAFGNNIFDTYQSGNLSTGYEIVERSDGCFTINGDSNAYFDNFDSWNSIQKEVSNQISGRVLDIGCGGGMHSLYFQSKGLDVYSMDNSPLAIKTCQLQGLKNCIVNDVNHFNLLDPNVKFDSVILWGNNLGLLQNELFIIHFFNMLESYTNIDSSIYIESMDPEAPPFLDKENVEYIAHNKSQKRLPGQMMLRIRYLKYCTPWNDYLFISKEDLTRILNKTNWEVIQFFDDPNTFQYIAKIERNRKK